MIARKKDLKSEERGRGKINQVKINRRFNIEADFPHPARRAESCSHLHQHRQREDEEDEEREKCIPNHLETQHLVTFQNEI